MLEKKAGRPKMEDLTTQLKFKVDLDSAETIRELAIQTSRSQASILRELIPMISSKDFESKLPLISLVKLQEYSEGCSKLLHSPNSVFEVRKLSENMPAFVTTIGRPQVHIKYPTYKIQVFYSNNCMETPTYEEIKPLLEGQQMQFYMYQTSADAIICNNKVSELKNRSITEIICLYIDLENNKKTKEVICDILKNAGYDYNVYPSYCVYSENIELLENGRYFKISMKDEAS